MQRFFRDFDYILPQVVAISLFGGLLSAAIDILFHDLAFRHRRGFRRRVGAPIWDRATAR